MAQVRTMAKRRKYKRLVAAPKTRACAAAPALEKKLKEAITSKELDCSPDFFTEPLDD